MRRQIKLTSLMAMVLAILMLATTGMGQFGLKQSANLAPISQRTKSSVDVTNYWSYPAKDKQGEIGSVFSVTGVAHNLAGVEIKTFLSVDGRMVGSKYLFTPQSNNQEYTATPFLSRKEGSRLEGNKLQIEYRRSDDDSLVGKLVIAGG